MIGQPLRCFSLIALAIVPVRIRSSDVQWCMCLLVQLPVDFVRSPALFSHPLAVAWDIRMAAFLGRARARST